MHEARQWPESVFVTLTYNDESLPEYGNLSVRDVQLFMKRLRKGKRASASNPVRFFLAGEYGAVNLRPHYHAILFNCGFADGRVLSTTSGGDRLFTSSELSGYWSVNDAPLGNCSYGAVSMRSAVYCAKYALKKVNGDGAESHYTVFDSDGVLHVRRPEFALMSRRPGIGFKYVERFGSEYVDNDSCVADGRLVNGTRFYDEHARRLLGNHSDDVLLCMCKVCVNKRERKREGVLRRSDNTPERLAVKEKLMLENVKRKERAL